MVEGEAGHLACCPGDAIHGLADAAEADGADRGDWLAKAIGAAGAVSVTVPVRREPSHQAVEDTVKQAGKVYGTVMIQMREAMRARLQQAAREADTSRLKALLPDDD